MHKAYCRPFLHPPAYITEEKGAGTDAVTLLEIGNDRFPSCNSTSTFIQYSVSRNFKYRNRYYMNSKKYIKFFLMYSVSKNTAVSVEEDMTTTRDTPLIINVMTEQNDNPLPTTVANLTGVGRLRIDYRCIQQLSLPVEC